MEVIVLDNASTDGSAEMITNNFSQVKLIRNNENVGFGTGNNQAMKVAKGSYFFLLNSDAFVFEDTLERLLLWSKANPDTEVVGCRLMNGDGTWQPSWGYFPTLRRIIQMLLFIDSLPLIKGGIDSIHVRALSRYDKDQSVDWVMGSCVLLKRQVFEKVGGFDEKYFMYGEEVEWMYRIKKAGFKISYASSVYCVHLQGGSSPDKSPAIIGEMRGWQYWFDKHNPNWQKKVLPYVIMIGCALRIVLKPAMKKYYIMAFRELWKKTIENIEKA